MKVIKEITDNEMIATFLGAEINSSRFGCYLLDILKKDGIDIGVIKKPNFTEKENLYRKKLLTEFRGFENKILLFKNFPADIKWTSTLLDKNDLYQIKYAKCSPWIELSNNTRLAKNAAENIKNNPKVTKEFRVHFLKAADALSAGVKFPKIILVGTHRESDLIVLEGHLRLTTYMLKQDCIPDQLEVIIGYSDNIIKWNFY